MRKNRKIIAIVSFLFVLSFNFISQAGQSSIESKVRYEVQVKSVRESPSKVEVWMKARFYNDSNEDIAIPLWGEIKYNDIFKFEITDSNGRNLVGPVPTKLPEVIPGDITLRKYITTIDNSPFMLLKANDTNECEFVFQPSEIRNVQAWLFPRGGEYTLTAEYVNTHSSYLDSQTNEVKKIENAFIGSVKSKPVKFTVANNLAETGFEIYSSQRPRRGNNMILYDINPGGKGALTISGTTINEEGEPLSGIIIEITANKNSGLGGPGNGGDIGDGIIRKTLERLKSDSQGKFKFTDLPPAADSFILKAFNVENHLESMVVLSNKKKGNRNNVEITIPNGVSINGKVVDQNGNTIPEVRVESKRSLSYVEDPKLNETGEARYGLLDKTTFTNDKGEFKIEQAADPKFSFSCPGYKSRYDVVLIPGYKQDQTWTVVLEKLSINN